MAACDRSTCECITMLMISSNSFHTYMFGHQLADVFLLLAQAYKELESHQSFVKSLFNNYTYYENAKEKKTALLQ